MSGIRCHLNSDSVAPRLTACSLLLTCIAVLGGCVHAPAPIVAPPAPLYRIQAETLRVIDAHILAASRYAKRESEAHARIAMEEWRERVRRRIEEVFIPWYSNYWTQQWIGTKVAWYQLQYVEGEATPEERLIGYLQEQFYAQVLAPVSDFVDPRAVMDDASDRYLHTLKGRLDPLPLEHGIPVDAFNRHLDSLPAIVVQSVPPEKASLYAVLQATDLTAVPAYAALLEQIATGNGSAGPTPSPDLLQDVARRAVTSLVGTLALRGGATAASTLVGGIWGLLISTGSAALSVFEHEQDKPQMETQLRENLDAALGVMWQDLVDDRQRGVTAMVQHMSKQIESAVSRP